MQNKKKKTKANVFRLSEIYSNVLQGSLRSAPTLKLPINLQIFFNLISNTFLHLYFRKQFASNIHEHFFS